jgi:hypothetical protein
MFASKLLFSETWEHFLASIYFAKKTEDAIIFCNQGMKSRYFNLSGDM